MPTQTSLEFKNSAIKLYLQMKSIRNVCNLLDIKKSTLHRWLIRYFETGNVERKEYDKIKSIVNDTILKYITESIKTNPTITLAKLKKIIFKNYEKDVSISYLYYIINFLHIILILFLSLSVFIDNYKIKQMAFILLILIFGQYITNYGRCGLTELEYLFMRERYQEGFMYRLVKPVITLPENYFNKYYYVLHILWICILWFQIR